MKNITELLASVGITIPEDKAAEFNTAFNENYKTVSEFEKKVQRLETERDGFKEQLDTAKEALQGFEGVDVESIKKELAETKDKLQKAEDNHKAELEARDFEDALNVELEKYQFTSKAARKSVLDQIKTAGLKCVDGKIIGLNDLIETIKETDADAFKAEEDPNLPPKAKFTSPKGNSGTHKYTKEEILAVEDSKERQKLINENLELFMATK